MATYVAESPSDTDVQAACDLATADGDIVEIPAGTAHWTTGVIWEAPPNSILRGAGTSDAGGGDQTVIIDDIPTVAKLLYISSDGPWRVTGITFQNGTGATKNNGTVVFGGTGRVDHCHFNFAASTANFKAIQHYGYGVIDHCILDFVVTNAIYVSNGRSGVGEASGNYEWTQPTDFGGAGYLFIEDCVVNGSGNSGGSYSTRIFDCTTAAKVVVRFNDLNQCTAGEIHATGHGVDDRGLRSQEIYGNKSTSVRDFDPNFTAAHPANGTALIWGNDWGTNVYKNLYRFDDIRTNVRTYAQNPPPLGWGYAGPTPLATGTVNVSGTAVTWASGDHFDTDWPVGSMIYIVGAVAEGYSGQAPPDGASCGISSVNSTTSITLLNGGHTGGDLTGVAFYVGSAWDGNTNIAGYPALDQPGRGAGDLLTGLFPSKVNDTTGTVAWPNQALEPIYIWANTGAHDSGFGGNDYSNAAGDDLVAANRDYYPQASGIQTSPTSPFDGTSGCGWGALANRPTTCTTGVAYFAIDQGNWNQSESNPYGVQQNGASGVLYVATATDTWTEYYEPYTYPHPLQGAAAPSPMNEAPVFTDDPEVTGTPEVGETLTSDDGTVTGEPTPDITYQWYRCTTP